MASVLTSIRDVPGLEPYLDELEGRLHAAVVRDQGLVARVAADGLAAGGKRLRPMLVFLSSRPEAEAPLAAGVAVELVHMATLIHDDLIDRAEFRRGQKSAWSAYGPQAAGAAGDYLFARAFSELTAAGDGEGPGYGSDIEFILDEGLPSFLAARALAALPARRA